MSSFRNFVSKSKIRRKQLPAGTLMSTTKNVLNPEKKARLKLRCEYRASPYGTPYALATPYVQIFFRAWNPASVAF